MTNLLIENNHPVFWVKSQVALLGIRQVGFFQHLSGDIIGTEQSLGFQGVPNARVDAVDFRPSLRHDDGGQFLFCQPDIFFRQFVGLLTHAAGDDCAHLVQPFERFHQLAIRRRFNGLVILLDARPFTLITGQCRILPSDGV